MKRERLKDSPAHNLIQLSTLALPLILEIAFCKQGSISLTAHAIPTD